MCVCVDVDLKVSEGLLEKAVLLSLRCVFCVLLISKLLAWLKAGYWVM